MSCTTSCQSCSGVRTHHFSLALKLALRTFQESVFTFSAIPFLVTRLSPFVLSPFPASATGACAHARFADWCRGVSRRHRRRARPRGGDGAVGPRPDDAARARASGEDATLGQVQAGTRSKSDARPGRNDAPRARVTLLVWSIETTPGVGRRLR
eukprot:2422720-Pleurochrysis_carterae.AAC.2